MVVAVVVGGVGCWCLDGLGWVVGCLCWVGWLLRVATVVVGGVGCWCWSLLLLIARVLFCVAVGVVDVVVDVVVGCWIVAVACFCLAFCVVAGAVVDGVVVQLSFSMLLVLLALLDCCWIVVG